MKQSNFKYSFKSINTRDNCALLARANHKLAMNFALFSEKDCFECLSPHNIAA